MANDNLHSGDRLDNINRKVNIILDGIKKLRIINNGMLQKITWTRYN